MQAPDPTLPFGAHKGKPCSEVPVGYLDWLIGQDWLRSALKGEIEAHLRGRADWAQLGDSVDNEPADDGEDVDWRSADFLK